MCCCFVYSKIWFNSRNFLSQQLKKNDLVRSTKPHYHKQLNILSIPLEKQRFARVGDNYILQSDPEEQTFRVSKIVKHGNFKPLGSEDNGDGRNDIALVMQASIIKMFSVV